MATLIESSIWEPGIYQIEESDLVAGGPSGLSNQPQKELANRTVWLKNQIEGIGLTIVNANKSLSTEECARKIVYVDANSASVAITLPTPDIAQANFRVVIFTGRVLGPQVTVNIPDQVTTQGVTKTSLFMGMDERLELIWTGTTWFMVNYNGNFYEVGTPVFDYKTRLNTVIADGQLLTRADYPRLWEFVQTLGASLIDDLTWNNTAGRKGFFSTGTNSSNFRVPDLRSMFIRGLDLGAGISLARIPNPVTPGGYEADEFKQHTHTFDGHNPNNSVGGSGDGNHWKVGAPQTNVGNAGGSETRPKNIGLIPLIKV